MRVPVVERLSAEDVAVVVGRNHVVPEKTTDDIGERFGGDSWGDGDLCCGEELRNVPRILAERHQDSWDVPVLQFVMQLIRYASRHHRVATPGKK